MSSSAGRTILAHDRARLRAAMREWAGMGFHGLRTRALIHLVWGSALRLSEALALEVGQVLEGAPKTTTRIGRVTGLGHLRKEQSKRGSASGPFVITRIAREALHAYILDALGRGWIPTEDPSAPLFVTAKGGGHKQVGKRAVQDSWKLLQARARVVEPFYRFHDLRHDALSRYSNRAGGDMYRVAAFGRLTDIRTSAVYVHSDPREIFRLAEEADR